MRVGNATRISVMNQTKWEELRLAMFALGALAPKWRTCDVETGYLSDWDGEWFYHFSQGGYKTIEWVELKIDSQVQEQAVLAAIRTIHLPGERSEHGFKVYGYLVDGNAVDYLSE